MDIQINKTTTVVIGQEELTKEEIIELLERFIGTSKCEAEDVAQAIHNVYTENGILKLIGHLVNKSVA